MAFYTPIIEIEHCPFCGANKDELEKDIENLITTCNECGRNFRIEEDCYK